MMNSQKEKLKEIGEKLKEFGEKLKEIFEKLKKSPTFSWNLLWKNVPKKSLVLLSHPNAQMVYSKVETFGLSHLYVTWIWFLR